MKKKFYISLLTLIFFISTTALPISVHLCKMMKAPPAGMCKMCAAKMSEGKMNPGGLSEKSGEINVKSSCCSVELIDATVKDSFLSNKTVLQSNLVCLIQAVTYSQDIYHLNKFFYTDSNNSPPPLSENEIYLANSTLLI